jgi:hypothetical protein
MNKNIDEVKVLKKRGRKKIIHVTTLPSSLKINLSNDFEMDKINDKTNDLSNDSSENSFENIFLIKKNVIINERIKALNIILDICPSLKKDKVAMLNAVLEKKEDVKKEYIVEKIIGLDFNAYIDNEFNILDENVNLIGIGSITKDGYYFFDTIKQNNIKMNEYLEIFEQIKILI